MSQLFPYGPAKSIGRVLGRPWAQGLPTSAFRAGILEDVVPEPTVGMRCVLFI